MKKNLRLFSVIICLMTVFLTSEILVNAQVAPISDDLALTGGDTGIIPGANPSCLMVNTNLPDDSKGKGNSANETINMQVIVAPQGWSGLSSYINPDIPDIEMLFQPVQDQLIILYNQQGMYNPSQQINTLENWNPYSGYIAKFNQETSLNITGEDIQNRTISLTEGWNLIPVLSKYPVNVETFFENYGLSIIREAVGWKLYWPEMNINTLDELMPGSAYYVMMNSPAEITFPDPVPPLWQCGDDLIDVRDGQTYNTVIIGNNCWLAENLNYGTMVPGYTVFTNNGIIEKNCYNDDEANCGIYGGIYQWQEMMQYDNQEGSQGICMDGWHIPTDGEFTALEDYLGGTLVAGGNMKATGTIQEGTGLWYAPNAGATNNSGFTALPGGYRDTYGLFWDIGGSSDWWSSTESSPYSGWRHLIYSFSAETFRYSMTKDCGFYVRCIRDYTAPTNLPPEIPSNPSPEQGATNQPLDISLSWECSDPEGDLITYDLYFGTVEYPPLFATGLTEKTYLPEALEYTRTYFWKIVANDGHNSTEGPIWSFVTINDPGTLQCGDPFTDSRDGHEYNTVLIGDQCWMVENLNVGEQISGFTQMTNNDIIEKYCYNNDPANCDIYGGLYQWDEMMLYTTTPGTQGICPDGGWYIPTDEDWTMLTTFLGGESVAGNDLKETGTTHWASPNADATNSSGFTALPGGYQNVSGYFWNLTYNGKWWTSSQYSVSMSYYREISYDFPSVQRNSYGKFTGFSVRCIKGATSANQPPEIPSNPSPEQGAINRSVNISLSWECSDPEGDPLTFDIYFGLEDNPPLIASALSEQLFYQESLEFNSTYYWKIVAHDGYNTTEGIVWNFTTFDDPANWQCGEPLIDSRDGQAYNTVQISSQCWMAQNLNVGEQISGSMQMTNDGVIEKYCYENNSANCDIYGGLYQWNEMMQYPVTPSLDGICPPAGGWHLPTDAELTNLTNYLGGESVAGGNMKETGNTHWNSPNTGATNSSGFTALPGGTCTDGLFYSIGNYGYFWSSAEINADNSWYRTLHYKSTNISRFDDNKSLGFSVRCVRGESTPANLPYQIPDGN